MPTPFRLNEFVSEINKSGFANPSYFMVFITLPAKLMGVFPNMSNSLSLRIEAASLPIRSIRTAEQRYYGPVRRVPYMYDPQPMVFSVLLSEDMREREIFMRWQDLVVGNSRTRGNNDRVAQFDAGYYDDAVDGASVEIRTYATSASIQSKGSSGRSIYDEIVSVGRAVGFDPAAIPYAGPIVSKLRDNARVINAAYKFELIEPFPINIQDSELSWSSEGYHRIAVEMQYRYVKEVNSFLGQEPPSGPFSSFLKNGIQSLNRFRPIISAIRQKDLGGVVDQFSSQVRTGALSAAKSFVKI